MRDFGVNLDDVRDPNVSTKPEKERQVPLQPFGKNPSGCVDNSPRVTSGFQRSSREGLNTQLSSRGCSGSNSQGQLNLR